MKKSLLRSALFGAVITAFSLGSCKDDNPGPVNPEPVDPGERWITVAGALMQDAPGDGNGGTMVYAVSREDAKDPNVSINAFSNGMHVKSNRTARLQSSDDGNFLYNIQYTGADGGIFNKYSVVGAGQFTEADVAVNTADYVGASPRWAKVSEQRGIAVNVRTPANVTNDAGDYLYTRGTAVVLALDLDNVLISGVQEYEIPLSTEEEAQGHHIWRLDAPVLNAAGNKLLIGTWMRRWLPGTTTGDATFGGARLGTKTVVVDYPSLQNPTVITSTVGTGDNSGYRSPMSHVGDDGSIYQATHRELAGAGGSHILRINQNNEYDNSYVFSLDAALGITDSYVYTWKYAADGIGYVLYRSGPSGTGTDHIARVDLNARTATRVDIPGNPTLNFSQYQGITVHGEEVYVAVAPVGLDGNIYIFNARTGEVTQGARLVNQTGNQYIGIH